MVDLQTSSNTTGCSVGTTIVTSGGGGADFVAVITEVNINGAIIALKILNHGAGYAMKPSVAVNDPMCMCNQEAGDIPGISICNIPVKVTFSLCKYFRTVC